MNIKTLWQRLRHRHNFESDLQAELEAHLELRAEDLIRQGMPHQAARRQAKIDLGMIETHKSQVRAARGLHWIDTLTHFTQSALRNFRCYRTLCLGSAAILGLAVAGNLALFAIDQSYRLAAPDVIRAGKMHEVRLQTQDRSQAPDLDDAELAAVQAELENMADAMVSARQVRMMASGGAFEPKLAYGVAASGNYFELLARDQHAVHPSLGRTLERADDRNDASPVMVLSDQGWQRLLPQHRNPLGKTIDFSGIRFTVVGVMPPGFADLQPISPHFWISNAAYARWRNHYTGSDKFFTNPLSLIGVGDVALTEQRLSSLLRHLPNRGGADRKINSVVLQARTSLLSPSDAADIRMIAVPIYVLMGLVLLVVCANLANLMLAKALAQQQELAIRAAIGASRGRLIAQLFFDASLIALLAAIVGVLLSAAIVNPLHSYLLSVIDETGLQPIKVTIDSGVWIYAFALCWVASLIFGLLPALSATRTSLIDASKRDALLSASKLAPSKLRAALCALQIAGSFVVLVIALSTCLLVVQMRRAEIGYETAGLIDLRHPKPDAQLRSRIELIPGVLSTTAVQTTPLYGSLARVDAKLDQRAMTLGYHRVDQRFLGTLGLALLSGRNFTAAEADHQSPVALISANTASSLWPNANALGQSIELIEDQQPARTVIVIGIVGDAISGLVFAGKDRTALYLPASLGAPSTELVIATRPELEHSVRQQLLKTCSQHSLGSSCDPWSFSYLQNRQQVVFIVAQNLSTMLAALALIITALGLMAVVRFNLSQRKRELGIRLAIGATTPQIISKLLRDHLIYTSWGLLMGAPIAFLASYAIGNVFSLSLTASGVGLVAPVIVVLVVALLAAWWPARAIGQIAPTIALRAA